MADEGRSIVVIGTGAERDPDDPHKWVAAAGSNALHTYFLDHKTATLSLASKVPVDAGTNPMAIVVHGDWVFTGDMDSENPKVNTFRLDRASGRLVLASTVTAGDGPCHLAVGTSGEHTLLFVAHYNGGSVAVHRVGADGVVAEASDVAKHSTGGMPLKHPRQEASHPHGVTVTQEGFLYSPDLGRNTIVTYKIDYAEAKLTLVGETRLSRDSAGPRHFSAEGTKGFVVCELDNTVVGFDIDPATGELTESGWASTLPDGWDAPPPFDFYHAPSHACGILYDAEAGRVYATNRGHDSIAVLSVEPTLALVGTVPSEGRLPWTIGKVGDTNYLLVSNQFNASLVDPGNVGVFTVTPGELPAFVGTRGFATLSKVMCATVA